MAGVEVSANSFSVYNPLGMPQWVQGYFSNLVFTTPVEEPRASIKYPFPRYTPVCYIMPASVRRYKQQILFLGSSAILPLRSQLVLFH
jgi:hypothetical protein